MSSSHTPDRPPRTVLVVAHPGHELRVHGWVERTRPRVFVLTDGSGGGGVPRIESSRRTLAAAGAEPSSLFGRYADARLYQAILEGDRRLFLDLADEVAEALADEEIGVAAGDAAEGYNPVHDVCRMILDRAVALAGRRRRRPPANLEFALAAPPDWCPPHLEAGSLHLRLDDGEFARKLAAARAYPELAGEMLAACEQHGVEAFRSERLWPAGRGAFADAADLVPYYEHYGERQVVAGRYRTVIRRRKHMAPLAEALAVPVAEAH